MGSMAKVECDSCSVALEGAVGMGMLGYSYTFVACTGCKKLVQVSGYRGAWSDGTEPVEDLVPPPEGDTGIPEVLICPRSRGEARTLWPEPSPASEVNDDQHAVEPHADLGPCPKCRVGRLHEVPGAFGYLLWD